MNYLPFSRFRYTGVHTEIYIKFCMIVSENTLFSVHIQIILILQSFGFDSIFIEFKIYYFLINEIHELIRKQSIWTIQGYILLLCLRLPSNYLAVFYPTSEKIQGFGSEVFNKLIATPSKGSYLKYIIYLIISASNIELFELPSYYFKFFKLTTRK